MSVQFIIGRAGTGKTAHFLRQTIAACKGEPLGAPILWIVPRQATFQTQRDLCCGSGLGGYFRVRVLSLDLLCREVLAEMGGAIGTDVTAIGRNMVLGRLLRQNESRLRYFRTNTAGLAAEIGAAIDEFERGGAEMAGLSDSLSSDQSNRALREKLADLELIHGAYNQFLGRQRYDPDRRLRQAMEYFGQSALLRAATIYVDGFLHFTQRERRLLTALAEASRFMQIALTMDPNSAVLSDEPCEIAEMSLFHEMEQEYRKLSVGFAKAEVAIRAPMILSEAKRFQSPALARIESWTTTVGETNCDGVHLFEAPDKRGEVEIAARQVRDWAAAGMRFRDIAVFARQLSDYHDLISAIFGEHDIPFFVDQRRSAGHHPLIQLVQAVLTLAIDPWQPDAMITIIKSGLCGLTADEADELENYCLLHGITPKAWADIRPWTAGRAVAIDEEDEFQRLSSESADRLRRRIQDGLARFLGETTRDGPQTARELLRSLFDALEAFRVREILANWVNACKSASQTEQAEEHEQVWLEFASVCDQFADLLGDELMTPADFRATLLTALEQLDLAIAPATVDQVLVGQVDRTRPPAVKAAIVLGLSDGQFPQRPPIRTVLTDSDRRALVAIAELSPDSRRLGMDEEFLGYFAFTRASGALVVTRPAADDSGRVQPPGSLWHKLVAMLGAEAVTVVPRRDQSVATEVSTPRQLVGGLMQWAREPLILSPGTRRQAEGGGSVVETKNPHLNPPPEYKGRRKEEEANEQSSPDAWGSLYNWYAGNYSSDGRLQHMTQLAWPALSYANDANLSLASAAELFPRPIRASTRELESFAACAFQHFARYGLNLSPREKVGVAPQDISRICRDVLDRLLRQLLAQKRSWADLKPAELDVLLRDMISVAALRVEGELVLSTARSQYLLERVAKTLTMVVASERALQGDLRPATAKWRYGDEQATPALRVGEQLLVSGQIDRVDLSADRALAVVHEYRLNVSAIRADEVYHGLSIRLFTDLLAWRQNQPNSRAVAALSSPLTRRMKENANVADAPTPDSREFALNYKPRGLATSELPTSMQGDISHNDKIEPDELDLLMSHVELMLARIGKQIAAGHIEVRPYKLRNATPCSHCSFQDVCRFENHRGYERRLVPMKRDEVLLRIAEGRGM